MALQARGCGLPRCALTLIAASACARRRARMAAFRRRCLSCATRIPRIYLFGTIHVRPVGADWGGANAHAALAASSDVWTEIEISPESDASGAALAQRLGQARADQPLSGLLTPAENARLAAMAQQQCVDRRAGKYAALARGADVVVPAA